ncbi:MAG TPA: hypothetical protein VFK13_10275 [Gemmatimonadaceae bacterium]|nr:hypothetical protein [Gemmatimonadaceae bacterium]
MPRYAFALGNIEELRQAGYVQSDSFSEALDIIGEQVPTHLGDLLEIGVDGFPPARYRRVSDAGRLAWQPQGLMAA